MWLDYAVTRHKWGGASSSSSGEGAAGPASQPRVIGDNHGHPNSQYILKTYEACPTGTEHKWRVQRASAVEKVLQGTPASLGSVVAAVKAVSSDVQPGKMPDADFLTSAAEGLLFEALVRTLGLVRLIPDTELLLNPSLSKPWPCCGLVHLTAATGRVEKQHARQCEFLHHGACAFQEGTKGYKDLPESVLEVPSLHEVELNHGKQDLPDFSRPGSAAGEPIMKERALLQVCAHSMQLARGLSKRANSVVGLQAQA